MIIQSRLDRSKVDGESEITAIAPVPFAEMASKEHVLLLEGG